MITSSYRLPFITICSRSLTYELESETLVDVDRPSIVAVDLPFGGVKISKEETIFANEARRLRCAIAAMDAEAEVAMAEFKAAAALQRDETLPAKERRPLQRRCEEASFRWNALCYAMIVCPAQGKRRLLAQIRELGRAAMIGGILHGNGSQGRGVSIRCGGPGLAWDVGERGSNSRARCNPNIHCHEDVLRRRP